jgi:superfamily II RNA helicase
MESTIKQLEQENKMIIDDYDKYCKREEMKNELKRENEYLESLNNHYKIQIECIIGILIENGYINKSETTYSLTQSGKNALCIKEVNSLVMNDFLKKYNYFNGFNIINIISLFSCFVPLTISEENNSNVPETDSSIINNVAHSIDSLYVKYSDYENNYGLDIGEEYVLNYNFMNYIKEWCNSTTEMESKRIIQVLQNEKNVFLGEFIKALVKIVNISKEVKRVANNMNEIELENKLSNVENLVLKYIVSTESLYL